MARITLGLAGLALLLAGCSGTGLTEQVRAVSGGAPPPETPEFITQTRAAAPSGYIPVGVTPPSRATPVRNASDAQKLEKELEGQRDRANAYARRPKPKSTYDGTVPRGPVPPKAAGAPQG